MAHPLPSPAPPTHLVRVIASGSSGNAVFVRLGDTRLLLDAGIPVPRIREGLADIGESLERLDAVLITHEHGDHIVGVPHLRPHIGDTPILCTDGTAAHLRRKAKVGGIERVEAGVALQLGGLTITPFATSHDAAEPVGYRIEDATTAIALATDLGESSPGVVHALLDCQLILLEANYCVDMLRQGPYPWFLKRRISSRKGHLSNDQMRELLRRVAGPRLQHVLLCHLSEENNAPGVAFNLASQAVEAVGRSNIGLTVAERTAPTAPVAIRKAPPAGRPAPPPPPPRQLGFSFME